MKLLHVDSSILGDDSISRSISREIVTKCLRERPGIEVAYRDLGANPVGHLKADCIRALWGVPGAGTTCVDEVDESRAIIAEFAAAEIVVIGAPMYNYSISTNLRSYIDRLCVAGETFRFTPEGHVGLLPDRPVIVASSRGSTYDTASPYAGWDHHEPYLRALFDLLGIRSVHFIHADGVAMGEDIRAAAIRDALAEAGSRTHLPYA